MEKRIEHILLLVVLLLVSFFANACIITKSPSGKGGAVSQDSPVNLSPRPIVGNNQNVKPRQEKISITDWIDAKGCRIPDKSDYLTRNFRVAWQEGDSAYVGLLALQGYEGVMRIQINENSHIDEAFKYVDCPDGKWFVGYGAVDTKTREPIRDYDTDNFKFTSTPNGKWLIQRCSDLEECFDAEIRIEPDSEDE
jgi:hypothetical protein